VSSPSGDRAASGSIAAPLWGVLVLPFGLAVGFAQIAVPYQLRARGADMTTIGFISFVTGVPHFLKFFWSPAIDAGWPRRRWLLASIALTAGSLEQVQEFVKKQSRLKVLGTRHCFNDIADSVCAMAADPTTVYCR